MRQGRAGLRIFIPILAALSLAFLAGAAFMFAVLPRSACSQEACPPASGTPPRPVAGFEPVAFNDIAGWDVDDHAAALATFAVSCRKIAGDPSRFGEGMFGRAEDWAVACRAAFKTRPADARQFFETYFEPSHVAEGGKAEGKITGYYEPELEGSRTATSGFAAAVYGTPTDLVTADPIAFQWILHGERLAGRVVDGVLKPYDTRAEIEGGTLQDRVKTLLYLPTQTDSFFLQIQGSGRVHLADGSNVRLGYGAQNGYPYVSIGGLLIARGEIKREDMSMQAIRAWLADHPDKAAALMNENSSYVFFVESPLDDPDEGPPGAENVPLTPARSMAVDARVYPYGVPIFVTGKVAAADGKSHEDFARLMIAQDTGGAIRGVVRGDIFFGWGPEAEARAGATGGPADFYVLRVKTMPAETP